MIRATYNIHRCCSRLCVERSGPRNTSTIGRIRWLQTRVTPSSASSLRTTCSTRNHQLNHVLIPRKTNKRRLTTSTDNSNVKVAVEKEASAEAIEQLHQQSYSDDLHFYGVLIYRLMVAYGGIYCISEYLFQLTNCNGPSMLPTMNPVGEIIFIDRLTPRLYGLGQYSSLSSSPSTSSSSSSSSKGADRVRQAKERQAKHSPADEWHEPMIPCNKIANSKHNTSSQWTRFWHNLTTGISRGDVVVVEHPRREGTVCKRVLGLPGDEIIVKKSQYSASHFRNGSDRASRAARKSLFRVPDGHVWLEGDNSANSLDSRTYGTVPAAMIVGRVPFRVWPLRGNAMMERGMRPSSNSGVGRRPRRVGEPKTPNWGAQGSAVLPAGYGGQRIIKFCKKDDGEVDGNVDVQ